MPPKAAKEKKETAIEQLKRMTKEYDALVATIQGNVVAIQDNYKKRARALNDSIKYIDRIYARRKKKIIETLEQLDWTNYFKCEGYPNNCTQNEVRDYVARWSYTLKNNENYYDWQLGVNERSLLTQDLEVPRKNRKKLEAGKLYIGDMYTQRIEEVVRLLKELEENEYLGHLKGRIVVNVDEFRKVIRDQLDIYLDNFTKDVIYNADGNMHFLNSRTLHYTFKSVSVIKKLWLLRDIPQPQPRTTHVRIKLASTDGKLWVPNVPLLEDCFVRELWTAYDHFSHLAPRYTLQPESTERFDYLEYVENEWQDIKDIENGVLSLLRTRMNDIELTLQYYIELEGPKQAKPNEEPAPKPKGKIPPREKLNFGDQADLDVFAIFEQSLIRDHEEKLLSLGEFEFRLMPDEVNLRNHRIMGGVQKLMVYKRPYKRRWSLATSVRIMNMAAPRNLEEIHLEFGSGRMILDTSAPPEDEEDDVKDVFVPDPEGESDYCIELKLPSHIYWFSDPVPCRWEPWEESEEFERLDQHLKDVFWKKNEGKGALFSAPEVVVHPKGPAKDFCLLDIPSFVDMISVVKYFLEPNLPYSYDGLITRGLVKAENIPEDLTSAFVQKRCGRPLYLKYKPPEFPPAIVEYYDAFPDEPRPIQPGCEDDMFTKIYSGAVDASVKESKAKYEQFVKLPPKPVPEGKKGKPPPKTIPKAIQVTQLEGYDVSLAGDNDELPVHPTGIWTQRDITSRVYDRRKGTVTFWTKRLGNFGLAQDCYSLLPYKNWILESHPTDKNSVYFRLETLELPMTIKITPEGYYLEMFRCNAYLKEHQKYLYNFFNLKRMLQKCGLDIFPREDAALYVGGTSVKDYAIELHTYFTMAICCFTHTFKMSEYNRLMSSIVSLVNVKDLYPLFEPLPGAEEFTPIVIKNLYCGPLRKGDPAEPWDSYFVSEMFLYDTNFLQENNYRDLFSYVLSTASFDTLRILKKGDLNLQSNIVELLMAVKPLSYA